jgi:hypothetical protein
MTSEVVAEIDAGVRAVFTEVSEYTFTNVLVRQDGEWTFLLGQSAYVPD